MERPRAADDFETIRKRLKELRRERDDLGPDLPPGGRGEHGAADGEAERRRREKCEGAPPPWVPTIFLPRAV